MPASIACSGRINRRSLFFNQNGSFNRLLENRETVLGLPRPPKPVRHPLARFIENGEGQGEPPELAIPVNVVVPPCRQAYLGRLSPKPDIQIPRQHRICHFAYVTPRKFDQAGRSD
jgi:hypothetical protein